MQLGLGTANFGFSYGVCNDQQMSITELNHVLSSATSGSVDLIDTAQLYPNSELTLGQLKACEQIAKVVTKLDSISTMSPNKVVATLGTSLKALNATSLYGCLLHRGADLLGDGATDNFNKLKALKDAGLVNKIGVSVYTPEELRSIVSRFDIDLVQLPLNLFDQRFLQNGFLVEIKSKGIEIHTRSAFLQGTLLQDVTHLPPYFHPWSPYFDQIGRLARQLNLTKLQLCLAFLNNLNLIDYCIVGTNSAAQLNQLLQEFNAMPPLTGSEIAELKTLHKEDEALILPTQWPKF